ncbi:WhiB family transcriptional regulator [Nonomuraea fuscirosea]
MKGYRASRDRSRPLLFSDLPEPPSWAADAACDGVPLTVFFGPPSDPGTPKETPDEKEAREARAREICTSCPVQQECRDRDRSYNEPVQRGGIWYGADWDQRQKELRRDQRRAAAAARKAQAS